MSLTKHLTDLLEIEVQSQLNKGTSFDLIIPLQYKEAIA